MKEIELRRTYCDILQGYSLDQKSGLYVKHLTNMDQAEFDHVYYEEYETLRKDGTPTEKELKELLQEIGEWTEENEREILELKDYSGRLANTKAKLFRKVDKEQIEVEERPVLEKLNNLENKKAVLLSQTCEAYAAAKQSNTYIVSSIFTDKEMKFQALNKETFNEMTDSELGRFVDVYNRALSSVTEERIKNLSISQIFQQPFNLVETLNDFFGVPVAKLTFYQILLGAYGRTFKAIFKENEIPESIRDKPDEIIEYVTSTREMKSRIENKPKNTSLVGVSSDEYEKLGIVKPSNVAEAMERKGDRLTQEEILRAKSLM
jgi:hypothetical protein